MQASLSPSSESFPSIKSASRLSACIQKFQEMGRFGNMKKHKISEFQNHFRSLSIRNFSMAIRVVVPLLCLQDYRR